MILKNFKNFSINEAEEGLHTAHLTEEERNKQEEANKPNQIKPKKDTSEEEVVKEPEIHEETSLTKTLEKCIAESEEIVRLFEKDEQKLIDLTLPILDLCQTNLNFQDKSSTGAVELLECSKKIIKQIVEKLKSEYGDNDPVMTLIQSCEKL